VELVVSLKKKKGKVLEEKTGFSYNHVQKAHGGVH